MRRPLAGAALILALLTTGCAAGQARVPAEEVETQVSRILSEQVGQTPEDVDCPEDLPAEVDASIRCTLTAGDESIGLTVTATEVGGDDDVTLSIQVDDEPLAEGEEA